MYAERTTVCVFRRSPSCLHSETTAGRLPKVRYRLENSADRNGSWTAQWISTIFTSSERWFHDDVPRMAFIHILALRKTQPSFSVFSFHLVTNCAHSQMTSNSRTQTQIGCSPAKSSSLVFFDHLNFVCYDKTKEISTITLIPIHERVTFGISAGVPRWMP